MKILHWYLKTHTSTTPRRSSSRVTAIACPNWQPEKIQFQAPNEDLAASMTRMAWYGVAPGHLDLTATVHASINRDFLSHGLPSH